MKIIMDINSIREFTDLSDLPFFIQKKRKNVTQLSEIVTKLFDNQFPSPMTMQYRSKRSPTVELERVMTNENI